QSGRPARLPEGPVRAVDEVGAGRVAGEGRTERGDLAMSEYYPDRLKDAGYWEKVKGFVKLSPETIQLRMSSTNYGLRQAYEDALQFQKVGMKTLLHVGCGSKVNKPPQEF